MASLVFSLMPPMAACASMPSLAKLAPSTMVLMRLRFCASISPCA
jgi:hypothetical protein